ncbi:MAG: response regulator [Verrucomicrobiota bacterium]
MSASKTILLVEDNPDDVFLLQRAFRKHGLSCPMQVVEHGAKAVRYLSGEGEYSNRDKYPLPRLIVLDLNLPVMNGIEFLKWRHADAQAQKLRTVVLTGSRSAEDARAAFDSGCDAFFTKSADTDRLREIVQDIGSGLRCEPDSPLRVKSANLE